MEALGVFLIIVALFVVVFLIIYPLDIDTTEDYLSRAESRDIMRK